MIRLAMQFLNGVSNARLQKQSTESAINNFIDNLVYSHQQCRIPRDVFDAIKVAINDITPTYQNDFFSLTWHDFGEILDKACDNAMEDFLLPSDKTNLNEIVICAEKIKVVAENNKPAERVKIKNQPYTPESLLLAIVSAHDLADLKSTLEQKSIQVKNRKFK